MPPRRTRNSDRPRASDRTMVATKSNRLPSFKNRRRCHHKKMKPRERKSKPEQNLSSDRGTYLQLLGWISRQKTSRLPAEGEPFLLTSPFIELAISLRDRWCEADLSTSIRAMPFAKRFHHPVTFDSFAGSPGNIS